MAITDNTAVGATKQDAIAELVQRELAAQAKLAGTVTDVSIFAKKGDKSCSFPKSGGFTVENRASGTEGTSQKLVYGLDKLDYDFHAHIQWLIENNDEYQARPDIRADYIKKATSAHARAVDAQILAKLTATAGYAETGVITEAKILNCIQFLDQNFATDTDRFLVVPPAGRNQMLSIANFTRADAYGSSNIPKGIIGEVHGLQVIQHAGATHSFIYTKEAIALAFQKGAAYDEQKALTYGVGSYLAVMDQLYGTKALRLGEGKAFDNSTALVSTVSPFVAQIG